GAAGGRGGVGKGRGRPGRPPWRDGFRGGPSPGRRRGAGRARPLRPAPPVLVLDEPAGGLDPLARIELREVLLRLARAGKTLLVTSHILPELSRICDRVAILNHGKLLAEGSVGEILRQLRQERLIEVQLA